LPPSTFLLTMAVFWSNLELQTTSIC